MIIHINTKQIGAPRIIQKCIYIRIYIVQRYKVFTHHLPYK